MTVSAPPSMTTRVLDAALEVFTERTYGGTAVPQVAERAGIGVGTIYREFPGKEALANAVYRRAKLGMLEHLGRALDPADPAARSRTTREQVAAVWAGLAAYAAADPTGFAFLEHQQHAGYLDAESREVSVRVEAVAVDLVRSGQAAGDLRDGDPALLVALVFGAFVGISKNSRAAGVPLSAAEVATSGDAVWCLLRRPLD